MKNYMWLGTDTRCNQLNISMILFKVAGSSEGKKKLYLLDSVKYWLGTDLVLPFYLHHLDRLESE
jgi:hypothetical protein